MHEDLTAEQMVRLAVFQSLAAGREKSPSPSEIMILSNTILGPKQVLPPTPEETPAEPEPEEGA